MSTRSISRIDTPAPPAQGGLGRGHTAVTVVQPTTLDSSDPFVLLQDDRFDFEARRRIGGAHPHAGLQTVTMILEGTLHDRDVGGLAAGDAIRMSAGRGIIHDEDVEAGGRVRILQLWIALPTRDRALEPQFEIIRRSAVPVVRLAGAEAVLYSGTSGSASSPTRNRVPTKMIDLSLELPRSNKPSRPHTTASSTSSTEVFRSAATRSQPVKSAGSRLLRPESW